VDDLGAEGIAEVMRVTDAFVEVSLRAIPKVPALRGKTVVSLFYEDSTRTRLSFETAAKRLSADVMSFSVTSSSVKKGESVRDTVETITAMGVDAIVVRHGSAGVPWQVAGWTDAAVINAGDGWHEHPTQALLDCYTIRQARGGLDSEDASAALAGLHVAIVGDVKHSRVARSDVAAFSALGAEVTLVAPPTLLPPSLAGWPVKVSFDLDAVLPTADVVYLLRIQAERTAEALLPSLREYVAGFGLTGRRARLLRPDALVMHPGPLNRGVEIAAEVADMPRAVITKQVANGVACGWPCSSCSWDRGRALAAEASREVLIRGGTVIDAGGLRPADVLVHDGMIVAVGEGLAAGRGATVLDAGGALVGPGFVDLHTHLRQPGREEAETVETGSRAAALGGYTAVVAMPNTEPTIDAPGVVREVRELAGGALCEVAVAGAITVGRSGERLAPMAEMAALGVHVFTDDGSGVQDALLMRRAMEYASALGIVLAQHCEDAGLAAGGHMHEGEWSSRLGLAGIPAGAEELMVMRDLALARMTGAPVHFLHLSTAGSVAMVAAAKRGGLTVTAEAAPHHFTLTDASVASYDPVFKVNPPLRSAADVDAVRQGLADGTLDAVATDHAPHPAEAKELPFDQAPPGMLGLETALALGLTHLVADGKGPLSMADLWARMSWGPATIAGLGHHGGGVAPGRPAHLTVVDPSVVWEVRPEALASRSRNTPYAGHKLTGRVRHTVWRGEPVVRDGEAQR